MTDLPEQSVELTLSQAEAVVLFEFLARFSDDDQLRIADPAEEQVLWNLHAELQRQLVEPLMSNYADLLKVARSAVRPPLAQPSLAGDGQPDIFSARAESPGRGCPPLKLTVRRSQSSETYGD